MQTTYERQSHANVEILKGFERSDMELMFTPDALSGSSNHCFYNTKSWSCRKGMRKVLYYQHDDFFFLRNSLPKRIAEVQYFQVHRMRLREAQDVTVIQF